MTIKFKYVPESKTLLQEVEIQDIKTIKDLKMKISQNQDFNIENIKIIFLGKILEDTQLINNLDNSSVHVIIRKKLPTNHNNNGNTEQHNRNNFNNIGNVLNQFQQNLQNTVQSEEFQNTISQIQQNLQNIVQNEQFQNNISNTINILNQNLQTFQSHQYSNEYNEEQENKINSLLNLNIINDRNHIINLLKDNNWNEETVANTLLFYSN